MPDGIFCSRERSVVVKRYNPKDIEPRWAKIWRETGVYTADLNSAKPKYIGMSMFNYPSGAGIHIGHAMNYTISDVKARFKRQQGFESYHPVGWDAFGLPAENYAIKTGVSPQESMANIIPMYHRQYQAMGWSNDWEKEISTHLPEYYKWSQWIFAQMYKHGLAYQDSRMQWWCALDNTVLANEQVIDGKCWRHDGPDDPQVEKKEIKQWFFKITDYADELLDAIDELDWTESVKLAQKNWIGKSQGAEIEFDLDKSKNSVVRSYIMGQKNIAKTDIESIGGKVEKVMPSGHLCVIFPQDSSDKFEKLINEKMEPGFWNEYVGDEVVFIFKDKQSRAQRIVWHDKTEQALLDLCEIYAKQRFDSIYDMLEGNSWYKGHVRKKIKVFTTRADTIFGATFLVLAPEHELVQKITTKGQKAEVDKYIKQAEAKSEVERQENKEKTGVFTGAYAINPASNEKIPIWIADYVLTGYGTGAIMAVPAHDERDHEFAKKYKLPIKFVVEPTFGNATGDDTDKPSIFVALRNTKTNEVLTLDWGPRKERHGGTMLIGGGLEGDETPRQAAEREITEETGYTNFKFVKETEFSGNGYFFSNTKNKNMHAIGKGLLFDLVDDTQTITNLDEGEKNKFNLVWQPINKVAAMLDDGVHAAMYRYLVLGEIYSGEGEMANSGEYDGMTSGEAQEKIVADLAAKGVAQEKVNYRMRDWSVSRQRYWGAPIPIVNCPKCGAVLVPDEDLPVILPELTDFSPAGDGRGPLARAKDWLVVDCPKCGAKSERETDTLDTYVDSSFYMLRYFDPHNQEQIFDSKIARKWEPIDFYNGADHATAHLLYARFVARFFTKIGLINDPEPFKQFLFNGKVTAHDGSAFSKTLGNGPDPLEIIAQGYGADAIRTYLMFAAPLELGSRWDPQGVPGAYRFLNRLWNLVQEFLEAKDSDKTDDQSLKATHKMIKKVTEDIEGNRYNTAIAAMMECVNDLYKLRPIAKNETWKSSIESLVACVAPFAPFIADELWQQLGRIQSIHKDSWPKWNEKYLASDKIKIAIQVNGKLRGEIEVDASAEKTDILAAAKADKKVASYLTHEPKKEIYVPGKLVSLVI